MAGHSMQSSAVIVINGVTVKVYIPPSYLQLKCHWHLSQVLPSQEYNSKLIYSLVGITFA